MATADGGAAQGSGRRETIESVIDDELDRQALAGAERVDVHAMAEAIDLALFSGAGLETRQSEARTPSQLNASNDV